MKVSSFSAGPVTNPLRFQVVEVDQGASWAMVKVTLLGDPPVSQTGEGATKIEATWDALGGIVPALIADCDSSFYTEVEKQLATLFVPSYV